MVDRIILNEAVALGFKAAAGGWRTVTVESDGGHEVRIKRRSRPRRRYEFGYDPKRANLLQEIQAFINETEGAHKGFLFKDWSNYRLDDTPVHTAAGGETTFQPKRTWGPSGQFSRNLKYFKDGLTLKVDGVVTAATVNGDGTITLGSALTAGAVVALTGEFYTPVRFEDDMFMVSITGALARYGEIPAVSVIEVLE